MKAVFVATGKVQPLLDKVQPGSGASESSSLYRVGSSDAGITLTQVKVLEGRESDFYSDFYLSLCYRLSFIRNDQEF